MTFELLESFLELFTLLLCNKIAPMLIRDATPDDLPRLKTFLPEALDLDFDPEPVLAEKLFHSGYGGPARCRVALAEDLIRGVAVTCGSALRLMAVEQPFRRRGIGSALLEDSVREIGRSSRSITVGAAAGNYLVPGIREDRPESIGFFRNRGFEQTARTTDMRTALRDVSRPGPVAEVQIERTYDLGETLEHFLVTEFGGAIAWEIAHGLIGSRAVVRIATASDAVVGFTACEINNAGIGSFGPQGVKATARGKGIGALLLRHSLADLRELGYHEARIPWVSSTSYYERSCSATIAGRYVVMRRR